MTRTISLYKSDDFSSPFFSAYSRFKHGSKTEARQFGKHVASVCDFEKDKTLVFYSAPHNNIHTASNAFKDYLLASLSHQFIDKNISVKQGKIDRQYSYDDDYGMMSKEDRQKAISSDLFHIDKKFISKDDVLVFIDDIKITGSHETRIRELLEREKIVNEVIFIYIAEYTGSDPTVEHELNHRDVNNLIDINNIIRNEEFIFNTRVVKFILKQSEADFQNFIVYQSHTFQETLFSLAILNNYHDNEKYRSNFQFLKDVV